MTVILVALGIVLSMFVYEPLWFDTRPHYYSHPYETKEQCQEVRELIKDKGTVCTDKHALYINK